MFLNLEFEAQVKIIACCSLKPTFLQQIMTIRKRYFINVGLRCHRPDQSLSLCTLHSAQQQEPQCQAHLLQGDSGKKYAKFVQNLYGTHQPH